MCEQTFPLATADEIHLTLRRFRAGGEGRTPVLLLHGASASHLTFLTPRGDSLADFLDAWNFDPWLLDWRGSGRVVDDPQNHVSLREHGERYNFNDAAKHDITRAIDKVRHVTRHDTIAALGFCMGGGILAEFVARGIEGVQHLDRVVLVALGLFYETAIDGRLKTEDRMLERLQHEAAQRGEEILTVDPRTTPWPTDLERLYGLWPSALKSHDEPKPASRTRPDIVRRLCNRLSFMYGMPYCHGQLVDRIHGTERHHGELPELFGAIPFHMYIHGGRNIRRGQATYYSTGGGIVTDNARTHFRNLNRVTLITGALNRLWHRESIDRMYEWLRRGSSEYRDKFRKDVVPGYGHQDLLWGRCSKKDVFPKIRRALRQV